MNWQRKAGSDPWISCSWGRHHTAGPPLWPPKRQLTAADVKWHTKASANTYTKATIYLQQILPLASALPCSWAVGLQYNDNEKWGSRRPNTKSTQWYFAWCCATHTAKTKAAQWLSHRHSYLHSPLCLMNKTTCGDFDNYMKCTHIAVITYNGDNINYTYSNRITETLIINVTESNMT